MEENVEQQEENVEEKPQVDEQQEEGGNVEEEQPPKEEETPNQENVEQQEGGEENKQEGEGEEKENNEENVEQQEGGEENKQEGEGEEKKEEGEETAKEEGLEDWKKRFVDDCSNEELKTFILFALEKIDHLSNKVSEQEKTIEELKNSSKKTSALDKVPDTSSEILSNPKRTIRRSVRLPSKPITELGDDISVERTDVVAPSSTTSGNVSRPMGMGGMMGMGMGGMMGELSSKLKNRSSTEVGSGPKKGPPGMPVMPVMPMGGFKLKSTKATKSGPLKLPTKN